MLAVLGDYLKDLNSEIESYEQLIAQKREEAQKLTQLQGQVVEALGLLKDIVDKLRHVDPDAISTIKATVLQIFGSGNGNGQSKPYIPSADSDVVKLPIDKPSTEAESLLEPTEGDRSAQTDNYQAEESPLERDPLQEESGLDGKMASITNAFKNGKANKQGFEVGGKVFIRSSRYQGKYDGQEGVVAAEPTHFGLKVNLGAGEPVFSRMKCR